MKKILWAVGIAMMVSGVAQAAVFVWDGDISGSWGTASNWVNNTSVPANSSDTDVEISGTANLDQYLSAHRQIGSVTFTDSNDGDTAVSLRGNTTTTDRDLRMDGGTGNASITVATGSTGNKTIGGDLAGATSVGEVELFTDLDIMNNGDGNLIFKAEFRDDEPVTMDNNVTVAGAGQVIFYGNHLFGGNTTINGDDVLYGTTAAQTFYIGADGVNNYIDGSGTVVIKADYTFDLTGAGTDVGDSWDIVNVDTLTETFHGQFDVVDFIEVGDVWTKDIDGTKSYQFTEATGVLTVIPEPATLGLVAAAGVSVLFIRRRLML